ncbi:hypothetical protein CVT24_012919 [Panaeolus cyanescens]|uniref:Uncharacterized protein n=1 Tax=Panaeolus cyanescens TaxID=181874 RepID=A0A409W2N1_9AGAR|nr:hypothetical protein CVT24_012919 [Panaeolus cyanescens]
MTDLTVLISPIPLYPLTAAATGNGTGKRWSRGAQTALSKPIMVTLERDVDEPGGNSGGSGNGRENESEGRREQGTPPRGRRASRSDITSSSSSPSASSSASSSSTPLSSSAHNPRSPPRLTNPPSHLAQDPDFINPPRKNRPRAGPPRVVDKHLLSPPVNTWKSRPAPSRVANYTTRQAGPSREDVANSPIIKTRHRPTRSQSAPPDRRSFMQTPDQQAQYVTMQDPSQTYVLQNAPPMMPIRKTKQTEVDEKLQLPFGDANWKAVGAGAIDSFQPRTQRLVGEPEPMSHPPQLLPQQLMSPSVDSLGLNLGLGLDDDDDTPLALTRLQKQFARRSFGGIDANAAGRPGDGPAGIRPVHVERYAGKGEEVQTAPINGGFRTNPLPRTSMRGGELLKPPPPLFRPTTFWRNHPRSGVASASYSPSSHLIRRATYLAAGLNFDAPVHDLSALCVESRVGSIVVKSDGEGAGLI